LVCEDCYGRAGYYPKPPGGKASFWDTSAKRPTRAAKLLRPSGFGWLLGHSQGEEVWINIERPCTVIGPTRSGKTTNVVLPAIIGSPGSVVTTSTRTEVLAASAVCRGARGPIWVFNPDEVGGVPHNCHWDPLEDCHIARVAMRRADTLVKSSGLGGENEVWATAARTILQSLLMAAAIGKKPNGSFYTIADVHEWAQSPTKIGIAFEILTDAANQNNDDGAPNLDGWHEALAHISHQEERMQANEWFGVKNALASLAAHSVRSKLARSYREKGGFSTRDFLKSCGTIYLLADAPTDDNRSGTGGIYSLFLDHISETAAALSQEQGGRIDPPLTFVLDELPNIHPWRRVGRMMSEGAGNGIQTIAIFQNLEQAEDAFGKQRAATIWNNCLKIMLGGETSNEHLSALSNIMDEIEDVSESSQADNTNLLRKSVTKSKHMRKGITPADIRRLPWGTAGILNQDSRFIVTQMLGYWGNPHAECIEASKKWHRDNAPHTLTSRVERI